MKKNYLEIFERLQNDLNKESIDLYRSLAKKYGGGPLYMGKDPVSKKSVFLDSKVGVKCRFETHVKRFFTKVEHIYMEKNPSSIDKVFIKGWQVYGHRYKLTPFDDLMPKEKIHVIEHLNYLNK